MGYKYKINHKLNVLFVRFFDTVDDSSLINAFKEIYSAPEYSPVMNQLVNYSDVTNLLVSRIGIEELSTMSENFNCLDSKWRTCIVAPDDLMFGYSRMYQILSDGSNEDISVVRTIDAAVKIMSINNTDYPFSIENTTQIY